MTRDMIFNVMIVGQVQSVSRKAWIKAWKVEMVKMVKVIRISNRRM